MLEEAGAIVIIQAPSLDKKIRAMIAVADVINLGKGTRLALVEELIGIYRNSLSEFLMAGPEHPISRRYPDSKKVVEAYRVIEKYINENIIKSIPSNP
jgi:hypothetical protein